MGKNRDIFIPKLKLKSINYKYSNMKSEYLVNGKEVDSDEYCRVEHENNIKQREFERKQKLQINRMIDYIMKNGNGQELIKEFLRKNGVKDENNVETVYYAFLEKIRITLNPKEKEEEKDECPITYASHFTAQELTN